MRRTGPQSDLRIGLPYGLDPAATSTAAPWSHTPVKVGLVGAGPWARGVHARVLAAGPETELAGVWARRPEAAQETAAPYGTPVAARFEELLDSCEAVAFAVPPAVQAELALRAAKAGKALLLEKPIAEDLGAARRLVDAIDEAGVVSQVSLTNRYHPATRRFLEAASEADVFGARACFLSDAFLGGAFTTPGGSNTVRCWIWGRMSSTCSTPPWGASHGCAAPGIRAAGSSSPVSTRTARSVRPRCPVR